jgi:hypothetical protein
LLPAPGVDPALAAAEPSLHASTPPPLAARRSTPPRGAFSAVTATPVPTPSDPRRLRALWLGWSVVGIAAVAALGYALSLPLPQEHVRTTRLAAVPEPAPKPELRAWSRPVPPAPASEAPAPTSSGSRAQPAPAVPRFEPAREPQRSARGFDARGRSAPRASAPALRVEPQRSERSSRSEFDAHVALPDGLVTTDEPTRAVLTPEPEPAQPGVESEPTTAVPTDPPLGQRSEARVAAVTKPLAEPPRVAPPTSALRARVSALAVRGSLPSSQVAQGIERVVPQLNECYRKAAAAAGPALPRRVQVELELDEQGRARKPNVRGASAPGLAACVTTAIGRVASRRAPDTGTVTATFALELAP